MRCYYYVNIIFFVERFPYAGKPHDPFIFSSSDNRLGKKPDVPDVGCCFVEETEHGDGSRDGLADGEARGQGMKDEIRKVVLRLQESPELPGDHHQRIAGTQADMDLVLPGTQFFYERERQLSPG